MSLGIAIYFGLDNTIEENLKLMRDAKKLGITRIFTSLHIPEANYEKLKRQIKVFIKEAKDYDLDIISDISPNTFKFLEIDNMDLCELRNIGIRTIRIDFGYSLEEIANMSKNPYGIKIQLNASTVTKEFLEKLDQYNVNYNNIDALHNFYPRVGTGISEECMLEKNRLLAKKNINIGAFVASNNKRRSPLKDGLPTLENHRGEEVRKAANHLYALGNKSIFIGDSLPSIRELEDLVNLEPDVIELDIKVKSYNEVTDKLLRNTYSARVDEARDAIRASESRLMLNGQVVNPQNNVEKKLGDITIDNIGYGRYMGELQILKTNQIADSRTNVVASVLEKDIHLLKYIRGGRKFRFNIVNE